MDPLALVGLPLLMARTHGLSEIVIGLIDGPVAIDHPDLDHEHIRVLNNGANGACTIANSAACRHGTLVAGVLAARRGSGATAICPGCTLLVRPIFAESRPFIGEMPAASPDELVEALRDCIRSGVRIINLSAALVQPSLNGERRLTEVLDEAARRDVLVVAAAGNQGSCGQHRDHPTSVGHSGGCVRRAGTAPVLHQPGRFHRASRVACSRSWRQRAGCRWRRGILRRHERRNPIRLRGGRLALVRIPASTRRRGAAGGDTGNRSAAIFYRSTLAECLGRLSSIGNRGSEGRMNEEAPEIPGTAAPDAPAQPSAHRVRLPGFITNEEVGLGDVIKRATSAVGIKPCGGCEERARRLNRWMVFTPREGR